MIAVNAKRFSTLFAIVSLVCLTPIVRLPAEAAPAPSGADTRSVLEARDIARTIGDTLWPNWSKTPFIIDLLTPSYELLLGTASVPKGFTKPVSGAVYRKRTFPASLQATFPAFNAVPVIVIGEQPLTASKTPTRWLVTLLHEHFHQWQYSWPAYGDAVDALRLANGDTTGMWMLNYAFPYGSPAIAAHYAGVAARLAVTVKAAGTPRFSVALREYRAARSAWQASLRPNDYRYFAFVCWQEGVARYTEYRAAQVAAYAHAARSTFLTAAQARRLRLDSKETYAGILHELQTASLSKAQRVAFYAFGAGEALLLDRVAPHWHRHYLNARMDLGIFLRSRQTS